MVLCIALSLEEHASRERLSKSTSRNGSTRQHLLLVKKFVSWEHRKDNARGLLLKNGVNKSI